MATLPFPPVERAMLDVYARWAGGQAATPEASHRQLRRAIGCFLQESKLLAPYASDPGVAGFVRRAFIAGWRAALGGHPPAAPCGWQPPST